MSVDDTQANDSSSHSRRGFLKRAAGAGLAGVTGLVAATEEASAANWKTATIGSYHGTTGWYIKAHGGETWGGRSEPQQGDKDHGNAVGGYVGEGFKDSVQYTGDLEYIRLNGWGWVSFPTNGTDHVKMKGVQGDSRYRLDLHNTSFPSGHRTEYPDYCDENIIKGNISEGRLDYYFNSFPYTLKVRGHASAYMYYHDYGP